MAIVVEGAKYWSLAGGINQVNKFPPVNLISQVFAMVEVWKTNPVTVEVVPLPTFRVLDTPALVIQPKSLVHKERLAEVKLAVESPVEVDKKTVEVV